MHLNKFQYDLISDIIEEFGNSKTIERELKYNGLYDSLMEGKTEPFTKVLFDTFFPDDIKVCDLGNKTKFVGLAVGYMYCGKASQCECARKSVSHNVSSSKMNQSKQQKYETHKKRTSTVQERYGVDNVFKHAPTKSKIKRTMVQKYGVDSPLKSEEIRDRVKQTCISKYGEDNVMKSQRIRESLIRKYGYVGALENPEIYQKSRDTLLRVHGVSSPIHVDGAKDKMMDTNMRRYGHVNVSHNDAIKEKIRSGILSHHYQRRSDVNPLALDVLTNRDELSSLYQSKSVGTISDELGVDKTTIYSYLNSHNIQVGGKYSRSMIEVEICNYIGSLGFSVETNVRTFNGVTEVDIFIPDKNLAIEVNGIYWHTEFHGGKDRKYHISKTDALDKIGITLIHIWDSEWNMKRDIVKSRLAAKLGVNESRIFARKCKIVELKNVEANEFLNKCHIQGAAPASIRYGLMHDGDIVMVMTMAKSRYNKGYQYELIRMASSLNTTVVGGASRLFSHFIKIYSPTSIVSYSDNRWNSGAVYETIGFVYEGSSPPSYYYTTDNRTLESRIKFQKHKLKNLLTVFDPNKTEWENMLSNGYDRVWDCGTTVWSWKCDTLLD